MRRCRACAQYTYVHSWLSETGWGYCNNYDCRKYVDIHWWQSTRRTTQPSDDKDEEDGSSWNRSGYYHATRGPHAPDHPPPNWDTAKRSPSGHWTLIPANTEEKSRYAGRSDDGSSTRPSKTPLDGQKVSPRGVYATRGPGTNDKVEALEKRVDQLEAPVQDLVQQVRS